MFIESLRVEQESRELSAFSRLLKTQKFIELYEKAVNKTDIDEYVRQRRRGAVQAWIRSQAWNSVNHASIDQLRHICQREGVFGYSQMSKEEMIDAIKRRKDRVDQENIAR